jgi:hypothetical protein
MTSETLPIIMYLEQATPCYLAVLANNNFVFMELHKLCAARVAYKYIYWAKDIDEFNLL